MDRDEEERRLQMGELSEPIFSERGGFPGQAPGVSYAAGQTAPPDIAYQNRIKALQGVIGTQPQATYVTTTFDARPINARDFVVSELVEFDSGEFGNPADLTFTVPNGYVGILRGFKWSFRAQAIRDMIALGANVNFENFILVDGTIQPNYDDIGDIGEWMNDLFPCYILADSNQSITLRLKPAGDIPAFTGKIKMTMHGNLLLAKSLPLQYEPGSI